MIKKLTNSSKQQVLSLFSSIKFSKIHLDWVLKGGIGEVWVDNIEHPKVALLVKGILSYIAGDHNSEDVPWILEKIPTPSGIIYPSKDWKELLNQRFHPKLRFMIRTNLSSDSLDIDHIRTLKKVPEGFELQEIDKEIQNVTQTILQHNQFYETAQSYIDNGVGFCVKHKGRVVSAAFSAFPFEKELEIDVWTEDSPKYRRKGLATAACAALIEYCLDNGVIPHWDAQDERSVSFALKLGYTKPERYEIAIRTR